MTTKKISSYFKKRAPESSKEVPTSQPSCTSGEKDHVNSSQHCERPEKVPRTGTEDSDVSSASHLNRDPGLRKSIWEYSANERDEVRRAYLNLGPYQPPPPNNPKFIDKNGRRFISSWYSLYPDWLEFSPSTNAAYCLPCFLFSKPTGSRQNAFTTIGFSNWKKVNDGGRCPLLTHMGKDGNSLHAKAVSCANDLKNSLQHIERVLDRQTTQQIARNRLQLKVSIDAVKWLAFQGCAFRGRDESQNSRNRGNFLELIKMITTYNEDVKAVVLENAPQNASYISHQTQKEILEILAKKTQKFITDEIGQSKFCIMVDESRDESKKEQMAIVLRFVDKEGFIRERFFDIVHVNKTESKVLEEAICNVLAQHCLDVNNIRGQGYDGASNMCGEWRGLQALILERCPYAYYVHCFAHRLQLVLVAATKEIIPLSHFFSKLASLLNLVTTSSKRYDQLKDFMTSHIAELIGTGELDTGKGKNQVCGLQRPGDTRWGSHLGSLASLLKMFVPVCGVLRDIINTGQSHQKCEADGVYDALTSFDFVFILHLMIDLLGITDDLSQALQCKSQEICNAMELVSSTKMLLQDLRQSGWDALLEKVKLFCTKHGIKVQDLSLPYTSGRGRPRKASSDITFGHHYKYDIFTDAIDKLLLELNFRFNDNVVELLRLSSALSPRNGFESFDVPAVCKLVDNFYPDDFTEQEKHHLEIQLNHFKINAHQDNVLNKVLTIGKLCEEMARTRKSTIYPLVDRIIRLVLTLPVSTATTERAFSAMKIVKTRLRNKMEDDLLSYSLITYIEKDIAQGFSTDCLIDAFEEKKTRRVQFRMPRLEK